QKQVLELLRSLVPPKGRPGKEILELAGTIEPADLEIMRQVAEEECEESTPMAGDVLLDTNIVIAFFAKDAVVLSRIVQVNFLIPSIVLGELHAGARKSVRAAENLARIDSAIPNSIVLN